MAEEFDNVDKIIVKFEYGIPGVDFPIKKIELNMGRQGMPGGKGDSGTFEDISKTALVDIPGFRFVSVSTNDQFVPAMITDNFLRNSVIGFSRNAITINEVGQIKTLGMITDSSFDLIPEQPLFLIDNGLFTQVEPESGWIVELGMAQTNKSFFVSIERPYYKEL